MAQAVESKDRRLARAVPLQNNHALAAHTTYRVGGAADIYVRPDTAADVAAVIAWVRANGQPLFVLGGGANILVADRGVRGVVLDTTNICDIEIAGRYCTFGAGIAIAAAAAIAARNGLAGLHHFYGMPGTIGGAVWMNARCYGMAIADLLVEVVAYHMDGRKQNIAMQAADFSYKRSPFQQLPTVMTAVTVRCAREHPLALERNMRAYVRDRYRKGHYDGPSAGSVFKNDRRFGRPSGEIIDSLGLRGYRIGDAMVSTRHANIFINAGHATATDFRQLIELVQTRVRQAYGIELEREVQYVGDW